jgi:hypothetical protein
MKPKFDLDGNPIKRKICAHCGKEKGNHQARTFHCPIGMATRTMGYTTFHKTQAFRDRSETA